MSGIKISRTRMIVGAVCVVIGLVLMSGVLTRDEDGTGSVETPAGNQPVANEMSE